MLVTVENPFSVNSWSGTPFSLREALARKVERLTVFSPGRPSRNPVDVVKRLWHGGTPPKYPLWMTRATLKKNAREVAREIVRVKPDAVLSISSQCIAFLERPGRPLFMFSDSPWLAWIEAYDGRGSAPLKTAWYAEQEAKAARRIDGVCFGSDWAVREGERIYRGAQARDDSLRGRLHVTPLGANWTPRVSREKVLERVDGRTQDRIDLLYVGKDWERKGGSVAVEVARLLNAAGQEVRLHIVGCRPRLPVDTAGYITVHGLLDCSDPNQHAALLELFHRSHFLLVPTMAECFGVVFAEAQAFALPPISRAVHALPTIVKDGETGLLMAPEAPPSEYVARILELKSSPTRYRNMAVSARDRFERLLNWDKTAEEILRLLANKLGTDAWVS